MEQNGAPQANPPAEPPIATQQVLQQLFEEMQANRQMTQFLQEQLASLNERVSASAAPQNLAPSVAPTYTAPTPRTSPPPTDSGAAHRNPSAPQKPRAWVQLPKEGFHGDPLEYKAWKATACLKLQHDAALPDDILCAELFNNLAGAAKRAAQSLYERGPTSRQLMEYLDGIYGHSLLVKSAQKELKRMRQAEGERFEHFFIRFERVMQEAGGFSWDEVARIAWLSEALSTGLEAALVPVLLPRDRYHDYVNSLIPIARNYEQLPTFQKKHQKWLQEQDEGAPSGVSPAQSGTIKEEDTPMGGMNALSTNGGRRGNRGGAFRRGAPQRGRGGPQPSAPSAGARAKWVDRETYEARRRDNLCLRCGASAHYVNKCPYAEAIRPARGAAVNRLEVAPMLEEQAEGSEKE